MADRRKKIPLEKFFPNGFDKTNPDDMIKLTVLIQEKAAKNPEFEGYSVFSVDSDNRYAIIAPMDMDSDDINNGIKAVRLSNSECADTASQKKTVQNLESQPQYEGYSVVDFVRISSSEFLVLLQQLDEKPQPPGVYSRTFSRSSLGKFVSHVLLRTVGKSASRRTPSPIRPPYTTSECRKPSKWSAKKAGSSRPTPKKASSWCIPALPRLFLR